jgi:hypothetical protein
MISDVRRLSQATIESVRVEELAVRVVEEEEEEEAAVEDVGAVEEEEDEIGDEF